VIIVLLAALTPNTRSGVTELITACVEATLTHSISPNTSYYDHKGNSSDPAAAVFHDSLPGANACEATTTPSETHSFESQQACSARYTSIMDPYWHSTFQILSLSTLIGIVCPISCLYRRQPSDICEAFLSEKCKRQRPLHLHWLYTSKHLHVYGTSLPFNWPMKFPSFFLPV
jgi:hypothetical protein